MSKIDQPGVAVRGDGAPTPSSPEAPFRVLVCGGRDYHDMPAVAAALNAIHQDRPIGCIIEGGAEGADRCAFRWAGNNGLEARTYLAEWTLHGRAAGPIRNDKMLTEGNPDLVVAFDGGRGTADLVRRARRAGIPVWHPLSGQSWPAARAGTRVAARQLRAEPDPVEAVRQMLAASVEKECGS